MKQSCSTYSKGFTLIELMVSVAIFTIITTIAVFNNTQFNSSVLLTNLGYEIALSIRQAQVYGVTVKKGSSGGFNSAYGIHFAASSPSSYVLFEDTARNHVYNEGNDPVLEQFGIQKGNRIGLVCVDGNCSYADLDITFERPNPDAFIRLNNNGQMYYKAEICVVSPQGLDRKITVEQTGQISVGLDESGICNSTPTPPESGYGGGGEAGYESGYEGGYESSYESGYEFGYESGYEGGYESGYEGGYESGYGGGGGGENQQ